MLSIPFLRRLCHFSLGTLVLGPIGLALAQQPQEELDAAIEKSRKGVLIIQAPPGTEVTVEQRPHEFWFGAALANHEQRLGKDITRQMAQWLRQADPHAVLFVNDSDVLTGARLEVYLRHIRALLSQDVPIGGQHSITAGSLNRVVNLKRSESRHLVSLK